MTAGLAKPENAWSGVTNPVSVSVSKTISAMTSTRSFSVPKIISQSQTATRHNANASLNPR